MDRSSSRNGPSDVARAFSTLHRTARRAVPFSIRNRIVGLRRGPRWILERPRMARQRVGKAEQREFVWPLAEHSSPLERQPGLIPTELQRGKEVNVALAARTLDGLVVASGQVFSHHHAIGRTSRRRGYRRGVELRDGRIESGIGGGLCQVSNAVYWVAVCAGMRIVERHRHGFDIFPDRERTVPFGGGATVSYNTADLRFENPYPASVVLRARVETGTFICGLWQRGDPGVRVEVEEVGHRFFRDSVGWVRENRLRRRISNARGTVVVDEEVAHNVGRVLYEPTEEQLRCGVDSRSGAC